MKKLLILFVTAILFSACSHRIVRKNYSLASNEYPQEYEVIIKQNIRLPDSVATKVGNIKLGESGFSTKCNEFHALAILKSEARSLHAGLVVITEEKRSDAWSSCYRCRAEFYSFNAPEDMVMFESDKRYDEKEILKRVERDRSTNYAVIFGLTAVFITLMAVAML